MNISLAFTRVFFVILSVFFMTTYMVSSPSGTPLVNAIIGVSLGILFSCLLIGFDTLFRKYNLRSFNIAIVGIFIGYLMGQALVLIFDAILDISSISISLLPQTLEIVKISLFLFGIYIGTIMTLRASDELYISIPFVKFSPATHKKKDLLTDISVFSDARIIDLAATGLLDHELMIPRFIIKELYAHMETGDENHKTKARRALESIKKLEALPNLNLRFNDTDFPEVRDIQGKLIRLARLLDANILTSDIGRVQGAAIEGIKVINMHNLSNALKPLMHTGEYIRIKIQRYGKEPRQGVGYLEDGAMVVVNGGGNYIGEIIDAQVLSVKHTTSGRMIFCNTIDEESHYDHEADENKEDDDL